MNKLAQFGVIPVEYAALQSLFASYRSPRQKIASLEKEGKLIRLKKGLYVVAPAISGKVVSTELVANHLYGPSYVSMESALRHYGLIPEGVFAVRSMTLKRSRTFDNSLAHFTYIVCPSDYYAIGVRTIDCDGYSFLMASPEKALCDLIAYTPQLRLRFVKSLRTFLEEDLRFDMDALRTMDCQQIRFIATVGKKRTDLLNLLKLIEQ